MANSTKVRLYYLGGLTPVGVNRSVTSLGRGFMLPPVGEYLDVPEYAALDLMRKYKVVRDGVAYDIFTRDARLAERVKNGEKVAQASRIVPRLEALSTEALLAELRARGQIPEQADSQVRIDSEPESEPETLPPYTPAVGEDGGADEMTALLASPSSAPKKQRRLG